MVEKADKAPTVTSSSAAAKLKSSSQSLIHEAATLFPKMDQKLLLDVLQFETTYNDWEGSVMLKVVYPADKVDLDSKKDWIYKKYERVPSVEEGRTLRFKAIRMYIEEIEKLLNEDQEIEYVTGSATLTPSDAYSA
jgi:hypothetical protein